jgi:carboxymethylenebutenolidase
MPLLKFSLHFLLIALIMACSSGKKETYSEAMSREHADDSPTANVTSAENQELNAKEVVYGTVDGNQISGYVATPASDQDLPGIIVIHEWWGLNENIKTMAEKLAGEGYRALAVDLYQDSVAQTPEQARKFMRSASERTEKLKENIQAAYNYLQAQGSQNIGSIGWCFGGGWSLQTAMLFPQDLDAAVIYYGRLVTDEDQLAPLEMPILGIFGEEDGGIPVESVREFESVLKKLSKPVDIHIYEGAGHAFANPSGNRYQKEAAEDAWQKTTDFFAQHLK